MKYLTYEKYKPSGIDWIGEIPEKWQTIRTKFVCSVNPSNKKATSDQKVKVTFLPMEQVSEAGVYNSQNEVAYQDVCSGYTYFTDKDVIVAKITPCFENGKGAVLYHLINRIGFGSTEFHVLRAFRVLNEKYLYYYTKTHFFRAIGEAFMQGAAGQKRISADFIKDFPFFLPSSLTQKQIVEYLDRKTARIDMLIEQDKKLIKFLKEERVALINKAVTKGLDSSVKMKESSIDWIGEVPESWEVKRLKFIGQSIIGLTYSPDDVVGEDEGKLVLRSSNIQNSRISLNDNVYVSKAIPKKLITREGDILICTRNGSRRLIGKNAFIESKNAGHSFGAFMAVFRSEYWQFVSYVLNSKVFMEQANLYLTSTINQLTNDNLDNIIIALPPKDEQGEIFDFLDRKTKRIDSVIQKVERKIELLEEHKKSLVYNVVTGKIKIDI